MEQQNNNSKSIVNPTTTVARKVQEYRNAGTLHLPEGYSAENALKSAYFEIQQVKDRNGKSVFDVVPIDRIQNALLNMVVQGMNVQKKQGYFIVYGRDLVFQRSYFGDIALVKRIVPGAEIHTAPIYDGEEISIDRENGRVVSITHKEDPLKHSEENLRGAYAMVVDRNGNVLDGRVMLMDRIRKSWEKSKTYKPNSNTPHNEFPDEMACRTVVRAVCKRIINSSDDAFLLQAVKSSEVDSIDAEFSEEVESISYESIEIETESEEEVPDDAKSKDGVKDAGEANVAQKTLESAGSSGGPGF